MKKAIKVTGIIIVLLILALSFVESIQVAGDHVAVLCEPETRQYYAPPFTTEKDLLYPQSCFVQRIKWARKYGYSANKKQADAGYFTSEAIPLLLKLLGKRNPSEWGEDGNWGYKDFEKIPY
ncbi:hypothetical protein [Cloacibacillus porcorum]|uniref:hypothetical protein n=1 Tax=Cloacibacillus porcorum TaxID=1197717 RepID=UPI003CFC2120